METGSPPANTVAKQVPHVQVGVLHTAVLLARAEIEGTPHSGGRPCLRRSRAIDTRVCLGQGMKVIVKKCWGMEWEPCLPRRDTRTKSDLYSHEGEDYLEEGNKEVGITNNPRQARRIVEDVALTKDDH